MINRKALKIFVAICFLVAFLSIFFGVAKYFILLMVLVISSFICYKLIKSFLHGKNKKLRICSLIALKIVTVYIIVGIVFGLGYGLWDRKYFFKEFECCQNLGALDGIYYSFLTLTTLGGSDFSPQIWFIKYVSVVETVIGLFLLTLGIGLMISECE